MKLAIRPYLIPLRSGNELPGSVIYFGKVFNKRISENMMGVAWYRKLIGYLCLMLLNLMKL